MDSNYGFLYSISGFTDYTPCFGDYDIVWTVCGCFIFLGTLISYQPQNGAIIAARSNFGINPFMTFVTNLGQGLVFFNIICLHASDFAGLFMKKTGDSQHNAKVLSTFLTVCNMALDWYTYKFVFVLNFIFMDLEPRPKRGSLAIRRENIIAKVLYGVSMTVEMILFIIYVCIGVNFGFQSKAIRTYASVCSIGSAICFAIQYIPQMVTTCVLRDRGSYSLVTLGILLVGTCINFAFMLFGQGEDWSTILPVGVTILEQLVLFSICIFFIVRKRKLRRLNAEKDNERSFEQQKNNTSDGGNPDNIHLEVSDQSSNNKTTSGSNDSSGMNSGMAYEESYQEEEKKENEL